MKNNTFTQLDLQTALAYDRLELKGQTFTIAEKWAINRERSIQFSEQLDERPTMLTAALIKKIKKTLYQVQIKQWEAPEI